MRTRQQGSPLSLRFVQKMILAPLRGVRRKAAFGPIDRQVVAAQSRSEAGEHQTSPFHDLRRSVGTLPVWVSSLSDPKAYTGQPDNATTMIHVHHDAGTTRPPGQGAFVKGQLAALLGFHFIAVWASLTFGDALLTPLGTAAFSAISGFYGGEVDLAELLQGCSAAPRGSLARRVPNAQPTGLARRLALAPTTWRTPAAATGVLRSATAPR